MEQLLALQAVMPGPAKQKAVQEILDNLKKDLDKPFMSDSERDAALEKLKIFGRDPKGADAIFAREGINTLASHGFHTPSKPHNRQALRCLANALLLNPPSRQTFVDLGFAPKACAHLVDSTVEDEFLASRILFYTTYGTTIDLVGLIDNHSLAESVIKNLQRHADRPEPDGKSPVDPIINMALVDSLNLVFNVTAYCPDRVDKFTSAIPAIAGLLCNRDIPAPRPLEPPVDKLVNALMNLKLDSESIQASLYPESDPVSVLPSRLIALLDHATSPNVYSDDDLEKLVSPLANVLRKSFDSSTDVVKSFYRSRLLPSETDRMMVLGHGDSLPSRLLRNTTNALTPNLRDSLSHLLFELCGKDASVFVEAVGYGFASGYLFQHKIPMPESILKEHDPGKAATAARDSGSTRPTNPITGQFLDEEKDVPMPEMTDEEKEREAERLFVLFERLKKTGIVDVENPVAQMYREGRVEELSDDEDKNDGKKKK